MKNIKKYIGILAIALMVSIGFAQTPPPPNNGTTSSGGSTPVGGGAPVGGGLVILVSMALAYGYARHHIKKPEYTIKEEL